MSVPVPTTEEFDAGAPAVKWYANGGIPTLSLPDRWITLNPTTLEVTEAERPDTTGLVDPTEIPRQTVKSSTIVAIGYVPETLVVEFAAGTLWAYRGVPAQVMRQFREAASVGRYFHANIKGQYPAERIG